MANNNATTDRNSSANVFSGKGVQGGYFFATPYVDAGNDVFDATKYKTFASLLGTMDNLGYIPEDGISESESVDINTDVDLNGDPINTSRANRQEQSTVTLLEQKASTQKVIYGADNVAVDNNVMQIKHNNDKDEYYTFVEDLIGKDGRRWRRIIPKGKVGEIGDLTINSSTLVGREVTIHHETVYDSTDVDEYGNPRGFTMIEFQQLGGSTGTTGSSGSTGSTGSTGN